jgi:hypothetical protein
VFKRIIGLEGEEGIGEWKKLHNGDITIILYVIILSERKSQGEMSGTCRIHWGHMGGIRSVYRISVHKPGRKRQLVRQGVDGSIILKWMLNRV